MLRSIPDSDSGRRRESGAHLPISGYHPDFDVTCERDGLDVVVRVAGDVDLWTSPVLWGAIEQALEASPSGPIVVDLEHLRFIDASGLAVLVRANTAAVRDGGRLLVLRSTPGFARRLLALTALDRLLVLDAGEGRTAASSIDARDDDIVIGRAGRAVRVTCTARNGAVQRARLREIVTDLIDGQGNLTIEIDLPAVTMVDLRLLEVLVESEARVAARGGQLSVRTGSGSWEHASAAAPRRDPDEP